MKNIKYTTDGKKVVVIGNLNSQEKIVQEIFVSGESEIPSGEHFVVKSLHDEPVISWKEKNLKDLDLRYEREYAEITRKTEQLNKEYKLVVEELGGKTGYLRKVVKNICLESFDMVNDFLLGNFQYAIYDNYSPDLVEIKDFKCKHYDREIKLITLFGKDDGTFRYRINEYSDGSGYGQPVLFFRTKKEGVKKLSDMLNAKEKYSEDTFKVAEKWGISLDIKKIAIYKEDQIKIMQSNYDRYYKDAQGFKDKIKQIKSM